MLTKFEKYTFLNVLWCSIPLNTGRKLNVHKTGRPGRLLNVLCAFNLRPVSTEISENFLNNKKTVEATCNYFHKESVFVNR